MLYESISILKLNFITTIKVSRTNPISQFQFFGENESNLDAIKRVVFLKLQCFTHQLRRLTITKFDLIRLSLFLLTKLGSFTEPSYRVH